MLYGILILVLANFLGASINPTFVKLGLRELPVFTFTALRFIVAVLVFLPVYTTSKKMKFDRKHLFRLTKYSIFFPLNVVLFGIAVSNTTVLMTQFFYTLTPVVVGILSHFVMRDPVKKNNIIGGATSFFGVLFLVVQSALTRNELAFGTLYGNLVCIAAMVCWASYLSFSKRLVHHYSPVTSSFFSFVFTAILMCVITPFELLSKPVAFSNISHMGWFSIFIVGIGGSAIMYYLMQVGVKRVGSFRASLLQYTNPLFAALTAIPLLGEQVTPALIFGGVMILVGVFYATTYDVLTHKN